MSDVLELVAGEGLARASEQKQLLSIERVHADLLLVHCALKASKKEIG